MAEMNQLLLKDRSQNSENNFFHAYVQPALAEGIGTLLFVFIGCLAVQSGILTTIALAHGFTIALLIMGLGEISGGHFNPAVTLGVLLAGAIPPLAAVCYFVAQIIGAIIGAAFVRAVVPPSDYNRIHGGAHLLGPGVEVGWAILAEIILTTILVFTVLMNAVNDRTKNNFAPFAIGFAVAVDIMAAGQMTGASMNPARSFGPAVAAGDVVDVNVWMHHYTYWVGPAVGAVIAALLQRFLFKR